MRSRWPNATVRSPRHSSTMTSRSPRRARSTAGSSRSAANPAPVPMRKDCEASVIAVHDPCDMAERQCLRMGSGFISRGGQGTRRLSYDLTGGSGRQANSDNCKPGGHQRTGTVDVILGHELDDVEARDRSTQRDGRKQIDDLAVKKATGSRADHSRDHRRVKRIDGKTDDHGSARRYSFGDRSET